MWIYTPPKKEKNSKKKKRKEIRTLSSMCISLQLTTGTVLIHFFSCYRSKTTHLFYILLLVQKVKYWQKRKKWFQPLYKTANIHAGVSNYTVPPSVSTKISMRSPSKKRLGLRKPTNKNLQASFCCFSLFVCEFMVCVSRYPRRLEEDVRSPGVVVTCGYERSYVGSEERLMTLWKWCF